MTEIIWLAIWPVLIWVSYKLIDFALSKFEEK